MGNVFKYSDNIDTDVIVPGKYLSLSDPSDLAKVCMEGCDAEFSKIVKKGDVIIAGQNFGCGSSREHAPISIRASGISCIIAESFARIFFRNAINIGLAVIECKEAVEEISQRDEVDVSFVEGVIKNKTSGQNYNFVPYPPAIMDIINAGGIKAQIINSIKLFE